MPEATLLARAAVAEVGFVGRVLSTADTAVALDTDTLLAIRFTVAPIGADAKRLPGSVSFIRYLGGHAYYNLPRGTGDTAIVYLRSFAGRMIATDRSRPFRVPPEP